MVWFSIGVTSDAANGDVADGSSASLSIAVDELRSLVEVLRRADAAAAAAQWADTGTLAAVVAEAQAQLRTSRGAVGGDIAATGASAAWRARAAEHARAAELTRAASAPEHADADAVVAVGVARAAVAEAVLAVWQAVRVAGVADVEPSRRHAPAAVPTVLRGLARGTGAELRAVWTQKPRSVLLRLVITLAVSLSLVAFYHLTGLTRYDDAGRLSLYLFSAVVGSVVCTNALCFDARRVRGRLADGERLWRVLVAKNLALVAMVTVAALPVIGFLTVADGGNPVTLIDQLITMVFVWLGVGNVLSVVYPLRHEPVSARLHDGTWKPYLFSFALSYGVGLTVNLMIYWRLWAKQAASEQITGGMWAAFALVFVSSVLMWVLLTVFAVACAREPRLRRVLSREMISYSDAARTAGRTERHSSAATPHNPAAR